MKRLTALDRVALLGRDRAGRFHAVRTTRAALNVRDVRENPRAGLIRSPDYPEIRPRLGSARSEFHQRRRGRAFRHRAATSTPKIVHAL
jgi:hypothetical protein